MENALLDVRSRPQWRAWLKKHHASSTGIWLVFHKQHTGVKSIDYDGAVCEALCFGWVDSLIKRLDEDRYARKFTPRKPTSKWSESNRKRWKKLKASGLLAAAGEKAAPIGKPASRPVIPAALPAYVATALKKSAKVWNLFRALAPGHQRLFIMWIHTAKKPETREKRIRETIGLILAGKQLGLR
jgi:uncharacterized protein YdeI (YjbR/CyaY-like superfamily)